MAPLSVPWGDGELALPLPDHWTLAQVARPSLARAAADWPDRLAQSLNRPEGSESLSAVLASLPSHGRIVLVLEDITRHSPLARILPIIVRELDHAAIADERVEILFATGMHPAMTARDVSRKIGPLAERFAWRCNNAHDGGAHVRVGEVLHCSGSRRVPIYVDRRLVQADLRLVVAAVTPHMQAGFGGGAKMFVPGCAALETISRVHLTGLLGPLAAPAVGTEPAVNPMRRMIDAAGDLVDRSHGRTFAVQYVLDADDQPAAMASGDLRLGQQMLAKQCAAAMGIVIDAPADIVITNAWPRDYDMWQAFKCIANTAAAVRPNGVICALAHCPAGLNMGRIRWPLSPAWTRRLVRAIGVKGIVSMLRRLRPGVHGESHFFIQLAVQTIHRNPVLLHAPELTRRGQSFPGLPLYDTPEALFAAADDRLGPNGSRRVIVFTAGGTSYPVL
ncbi:MAG: DUF2088 domain-containing protein [Planctomycetes bacterium]|nr:DUF2088 domain-containing protein [Planctomycetota bacterium]